MQDGYFCLDTLFKTRNGDKVYKPNLKLGLILAA